jgi:four helix bundle protein
MSERIQSFRELVAWQKAFRLGCEVHRLSRDLPAHELYGLQSQLRRGAVSIASNIAEGYGRGSHADYLRFLKVARGAMHEVETQILFALDFHYISGEQYRSIQSQIDEAQRVLAGLIRSLENRQADSN